ncbi:hypothetical protein HXZ93_01650 [Acinetobacter pseudolwoffii]|uniref:hypothetical protein n=1 Tax=Acinetobacter pseudolwoffii TaxID=2053287 RepID=UPI0025764CEF|nr:hypothetical protein [Acinetobacter pseudolwoffii]MDM1334749.1 hypothetical protein [Acinetobacter pseudolwoffii]
MADQPITKEKLIKADIDADNLGKAANELGTVNPRYGNPYKTAPQTIQDLQQKADQVVAQGFYKGFATETLLKASKPTVSEMRARADDTRKIYRWNRASAEGVTPVEGEWTDTGLSDKDLAEDYTDRMISEVEDKISENLTTNLENDLDITADKFGNVYRRTDNKGRLFLPGLEDSVQDVINNLGSEVLQTVEAVASLEPAKGAIKFDYDNNLDTSHDPFGNVYRYTNERGEMFLTGMDGSVQEEIQDLKQKNSEVSAKSTDLLRKFKKVDLFEPAVLEMLSFASTQEIGKTVPAPLGIYKQRFSIGNSWMSNYRFNVDPPYIPVVTPYGNDRGVVHPHILEFPNGFNGWRYLVGATGYTGSSTREENPFLYGSNDLESFTLLTGLLDEPDVYSWEWGIKYNSDIALAHDPISNELIVIWRRYEPITVSGAPSELKTKSYFYAVRTRDLVNFSERELIWESTPGSTTEKDIVSPAFVYDAQENIWHMFGCTSTRTATQGVVHFTSSELKPGWVFQNYIAMPDGSNPWHLDARWVGNKIVMLIQERDSSYSNTGLRFGVQRTVGDFINFDWDVDFINKSGANVYKGTFCPEFNDVGEMRLNLLWTFGPGASNVYKFLVHKSEFLNVERS